MPAERCAVCDSQYGPGTLDKQGRCPECAPKGKAAAEEKDAGDDDKQAEESRDTFREKKRS